MRLCVVMGRMFVMRCDAVTLRQQRADEHAER
jgi:hypothetical protein